MDVLEQIWQYLNHRGLTKSCKALKKEASLNGKQDAAALKSALDMFERKTQKEKSVLANETKKLEIQPEKVVKKAKKEKKSKKLKSKEDASVVVEKQTATSPTAEASEEDTTTLISESKDSTTSLIDGLTEIINQSSTEQEQEAEHTSKKRKLDDLDDTPHKSRNEKAISVLNFNLAKI